MPLLTVALPLHGAARMDSVRYTQGAPLSEEMPPVQIDVLARRYYDLFNERKLDEAERFVHPQAIFTYLAAKEHLIGRAGYRELTRRWIQGFPDAWLTITKVTVIAGTRAQTDWIGHGTHKGPLEIPGLPTLPPSGAQAKLPMRETIRIDGGLIVESKMEFDPQALRAALGL
jgi:predicted ester cyclase